MVRFALWILGMAMRKDPDYARSWHANLSMMAQDAGAGWKEANERAKDFMHGLFGVKFLK